MPIDPTAPFPTNPEAKSADDLGDLRRRVEALERGTALVDAGAGAPAASVTARFYVDTTNHRLYVNDNGTYRYAGLT